MTPQAQRALLAIAVMAAQADGEKSDAERAHLRQIVQALPGADAALTAVVADVLLGRARLDDLVADLGGDGERRLAYEWALGMCDADGRQSEAERGFLQTLRGALGLDAAALAPEQAQTDALAELTDAPALGAGGELMAEARPVATNPAGGPTAVPMAGTALTPAAAAPAAVAPPVDEAALDRSILNHAILNGALELLPQSWATMAIIPLQVKLVYRVGQAYGHELDQGHIKEFIATAGVGLTSQYLEQFGRKLLGGLLGKVGGGLGRALGGAATGMGLSFASTYALGQLAKRYYAGGRHMNAAVLRETYEALLGPARTLQQQMLPQIQQRSRGLDVSQIAALVRRA